MSAKYEIILLLGSNLGNKEQNLEKAKHEIVSRIGELVCFSPTIESAAHGYQSESTYLNCAEKLFTSLSPIQLLKQLKQIEFEMGRKEDTSQIGFYTDRIIDIDIVKFSGLDFYSSKLVIPHKKHLFEREFSKNVLEQLP